MIRNYLVVRPIQLLGIWWAAFALQLLSTGTELRNKVNHLLSSWEQAAAPGASVVIVRNRSVVYERSFGYASLEHKVKINSKTVFDGASLAKQFTGFAIAMLIERGQLALDDDVRKYLTPFPDFGRAICIHSRPTAEMKKGWPEVFWPATRQV